ncbi:helix-turn-helix domain-containing protein [Hippea maritima]|uniref:Helix-turn-helix domain protein n=1 Tax=Hippea maritima (strain ATCC 700847 / DSM 10411 / MH2) TaxID=760142 RepID=F2LV76_HIPMA|nr:helix-turn-helix transcriptional regulator [Hippea maritima]AEA33660.1 helix-turn-helix domain protein [Hippea maritima DSM 10411]
MSGSLGERLKAIRQAKGLSQKEMAEIMDVTLRAYQRYEKDEQKASYEKLARIVYELKDINSNWLLTGEGDMFIKNGMPEEFLERLKEDLSKASAESVNSLSFKDRLDAVLSGREKLERVEVIELARVLKQPAEEYLKLANYMPEIFSKVLNNDKVVTMLRSMGDLNDKEIDEVVESLSLVLEGYLSKKKKD